MDEKELQKIDHLTEKFMNGSLTADEKAELDAWMRAHPDNEHRFNRRINLDQTWNMVVRMKEGEAKRDKARIHLQEMIDNTPNNIVPLIPRRWRWYASGAAALIIVVGSIFYYNSAKHAAVSANTQAKVTDLPPGTDRAILELADGSRLDLAKAPIGTLAAQTNTEVVKSADGQILYKATEGKTISPSFNTVSTPLGGKFMVTLPDKTVAWLNAGSSIRFPTSFTSSQREVEMKGEAYFEVAKDRTRPFIVKVVEKGFDVRVLGTHFNIKAYAEEPVSRATLLEGSIQLQKGNKLAMLIPGQQANVNKDIEIAQVDTEQSVGWKDGYFMFKNAEITAVMKELARWYNVDIKYGGSITNKKLTARVSRNKNASDVLDILRASGYHCSITEDGKTIIILP